LRDQYQAVENIIKELDEPVLPTKKLKIIKNMQEDYKEIIMNIFKRIYFDLTMDSIEKLSPLLPEDPYDEFFGEIIGIMYAILKSLKLLREKIDQSFELNLLKEKIDQSFEPDSKFYEDYVMKKCLHLIKFITLDLNDLIVLLKCEMRSDIYNMEFSNDLNVSTQLKKIDGLREKLETANGQKVKNSRITDLQFCLMKVSNIEEGLMNLFRTIILVGLEHKRKTSRINFIPNLSKEDKALDNQTDTKTSYEYVDKLEAELKDIERLEKELMDNTNTEPPKLLPDISELSAKIVDKYDIITNDETYAYDHIHHSLYYNMYRALQGIRDDISEKLENLEENLQTLEKYPYLFPEIAELCNF
jgi:hypothetical protein